MVSIVIGQPINLGLAPKEITMLALTLLVSVITLGTGRSTVLQGVVHLVIFAAVPAPDGRALTLVLTRPLAVIC